MTARRLGRVVGGLLLSGLLCQTLHAQPVERGSTRLLASGNPYADDLRISYLVRDIDGMYAYSYTVSNPQQGPTTVTGFDIGFDATPNSVVPDSINLGGILEAGSSVTWSDVIGPGDTGTFSFTSPYAPVMVDEKADGAIVGPWISSNAGGTLLPVPNVPVVPEPETLSLIGAALLVLPFRMKRKAARQ